MLKTAFVSDAPDCSVMIEHLRRYTRAKSGHPKHDEHSHCADSVRGVAVAMAQFKNVSERKRHQKAMAAQVRVIPTVNHWGRV